MDRPPLPRLMACGALGGALAGCINAWHALSVFSENLEWHIIPAGAVHGALLACLSLACAWWLMGQGAALRYILAPVAGYIVGYATYLPLCLSAGFDLKIYLFPGETDGVMRFAWPLCTFGCVAVIACLGWGSLRLLPSKHLLAHLAIGCAAGVIGSLWWWSGWEETWFAIPHGLLWGCAVGLGAWKAGRGNCECGTC